MNVKYHQTEVNIDEYHFEENSSEELLSAIKEFINNVQETENFKKKINFNEKQILLNKILNERLEEIYNIDVLKNNYFKKDTWKKMSLLRLLKGSNPVKELFHFHH